jgi:hypothetical protein
MDATVAIGRYIHIHKLAMLAETKNFCFDNRTGSSKQPRTMDHVSLSVQILVQLTYVAPLEKTKKATFFSLPGVEKNVDLCQAAHGADAFDARAPPPP